MILGTYEEGFPRVHFPEQCSTTLYFIWTKIPYGGITFYDRVNSSHNIINTKLT